MQSGLPEKTKCAVEGIAKTDPAWAAAEMPIIESEQDLFSAWQNSSGAIRGQLFSRVLPLLGRRAYAICCAQRCEYCPDLVQAAISWALLRPEIFDHGDGRSHFDQVVASICESNSTRGWRARPAGSRHALEQLTEGELRLLDLTYEGLTEPEIAQALGIAPDEVVARWSAVRARVAANLQGRSA